MFKTFDYQLAYCIPNIFYGDSRLCIGCTIVQVAIDIKQCKVRLLRIRYLHYDSHKQCFFAKDM